MNLPKQIPIFPKKDGENVESAIELGNISALIKATVSTHYCSPIAELTAGAVKNGDVPRKALASLLIGPGFLNIMF